jgi:hypothetical protein
MSKYKVKDVGREEICEGDSRTLTDYCIQHLNQEGLSLF